MTTHEQYFEYLATRSRLGLLYRRYWLYPRLTRRLAGHTLDIGCGLGDMLAYRPNSVGVDVNPHAVRHCRERGLDARTMQPDCLPFSEAQFDSVVLDNVLEHITDPEPLLAEVHRVTRAGGLLLVGVPGTRGWACDEDHKVFYDEAALRARVCAAGFECTEVFFTPAFRSKWMDQRMRLYCVWGLFTKYT